MKCSLFKILALGIVLLAGPVLAKSPIAVSVDYAGYGFNTPTELVSDGQPVDLSVLTGKGTFGKSSIAITVEFIVDASVIENCPDGYDVPLAILDIDSHLWAFTTTAADNSQVFGYFKTGWMCLTADKIDYVGEASGIYFDGSGRYEGATGDWVSTFEGKNLDSTIGFRSMTGDITGTLYLP